MAESPCRRSDRVAPSVQAVPCYVPTGLNAQANNVTSLHQNKDSALTQALANRKRIVIISGAGISTNAGISDFRSLNKTKLSSRCMFSLSALSSEVSTLQFFNYVGTLIEHTVAAEPTAFHRFMDDLASKNRLHRHYTQNIDCLDTKLDFLVGKTIHLHGRIDAVICSLCQDIKYVTLLGYNDLVGSECESCFVMNESRVHSGKRKRRLGVYRPKVLLYGEENPDETDITAAFEEDLFTDIDAVVIAGTRLQIPTIRKFAYQLCKTVQSREGSVIWVSEEAPKLGSSFERLIEKRLVTNCDHSVA